MERQLHGFSFEQSVAEKYGVALSDNYTDKWDGRLDGIPVSIKTEKYGSDVEMADVFRQMDVSEDFYLIVGFWDGDKTNIVEQHILKVNGEEYSSLFNRDFAPRLHDLLDNITNDRSDDAKWKTQITLLRKEWKEQTPNLVRLRFKRDHKSQKRIQCAINNKDFYNHFIPNYEVTDGEW